MTEFRSRTALLCAALAGAGCSLAVQRDGGPPPGSVPTAQVADAVPRAEPRSKYGNPESYVVFGKRYFVMKDSAGYVEKGIASWYGKQFHGRRTSSGETYDMYAMTAAHKTLPLPTYARVTNIGNGKSVILRINDRGPFHGNRIIDLSYTAASRLDILGAGTGLVEVRALQPGVDAMPDAPAPTGVAGSGPASFYIQVGAFASRANAEALRNRFGTPGDFLISVTEALVDGRTLFRVRIGPLDDVEIADNIVARLGALGIGEYSIVTD